MDWSEFFTIIAQVAIVLVLVGVALVVVVALVVGIVKVVRGHLEGEPEEKRHDG